MLTKKQINEVINKYECWDDSHIPMAQQITNFLLKIESIPENGKIVMLGSYDCKIFNQWVSHWGEERCLGVDLSSYGNEGHPCLKIIDASLLPSAIGKTPIAMGFNDLPVDKRHNWEFAKSTFLIAENWLHSNIVKGGILVRWKLENREKYPPCIKTDSQLMDENFKMLYTGDVISILVKL